MRPIAIPSNRPPDRFYRGGRRITDFRGEAPAGTHEPEDWIASTTHVFRQAPLGQTVLPDGRGLAEAVTDEPLAWLGDEHLRAWGVDTKLLVKLLDAGQRLPVHAHPDGSFAHQYLGRRHGKAEAWYILTAGTVYLGLKEDISEAELRLLVDAQDTDGLLGLLHAIPVVPGDAVFVPAGQLHAIGEGVFLVEVQEPEDLSILVEWKGFDLDGERDGHLGLGFDTALRAVSRARVERSALDELVAHVETGSALPVRARSFFTIERVRVAGEVVVTASFAVLVVLDGAVEIDDEVHAAGATLVVPFDAGALRVAGDGTVLVCRPPSR
ncbi:MAG: carbohydrate kinase [Frondihabitans sp.]|nr:carbohydrate kinase [Frondihabitans sp.]